jgi:hypothetical protein
MTWLLSLDDVLPFFANSGDLWQVNERGELRG